MTLQKQSFADVLQNSISGPSSLQLYVNETPTQVLSREICETFKEHLFLQNASGGSFWLRPLCDSKSLIHFTYYFF